MAVGIAHEIRNPLTSIKGFLQLLHKKYQQDEFYFRILFEELDRINFIVGEFLILAKPNPAKLEKKDIHSIISDVVSLIDTYAILKNVQISVDHDNNPIFIMCDENQLKQVFIN